MTIARPVGLVEDPRPSQPLAAEDLLLLQFITELQVSPDGNWVAFIVARMDADADSIRSDLWLVAADGSAPAKRLTAGDSRDRNPRWSPDSRRVGFLSNRETAWRSDLYLVDTSGAAAVRALTLPYGIADFAWAPSGDFALVGPSKPPRASRRAAARSSVAASAPHYVRGPKFRADGVGLLDEDRPQLWVATVGSEPRVIVEHALGCSQPTWTPDGRVAFLSELDESTRIVDVYSIASDGSDLRCETARDKWIDSYCFGPALAVNGNTPTGVWLGNDHHIYVGSVDASAPLARSTAQRIHNDWLQNTPVPPRWSNDGRVFFQVSDRGSVHLYSTGIGRNKPALVLAGRRAIQNFDLGGASIAFTSTAPEEPFSLRSADLDGANERLLFDPNPWLKDRALGAVRSLSAPPQKSEAEANSGVGETSAAEVEGWVLLPPGYREGERLATVLFLHGGPNAGHGWNFSPIFHVLAGAGYAVIYCNPPGSQSYGEAFARRVTGAWGEADFPSLMAFVDAAVGQGFADGDRLGVTGRSYGGFSTLWTISHTTRFRAAVAAEPVTDLESFYGSSDIGWDWGALQMGAEPWEAPERYRRLSPTTYADRITTPLRLIACLDDFRTPYEQAEQMYLRLAKLGKVADLVLLPGESHTIVVTGRPWSRVHHMRATLEWFKRFLPP